MRFEVSRVMDTIEQRLTTDLTLAQAVVDLSDVTRCVALDDGRPVNLLRVGMAVDALGRYLIDASAMLYPVVGRELLSESAWTSKERMVVSRWGEDGLAEVVPVVGDRAVEVADLTGLPLITVRSYEEYADRYPWLKDSPERVLRLRPRGGDAALTPGSTDGEHADDPELARAVAVGKASPPGEVDGATVTVDVFTLHGVERLSHTWLTRRHFVRAEPSERGAALTSRHWRCPRMDCPAFGEFRRIGQPVPGLRKGAAVCSRHGDPLKDLGPRPPAYAVSLVVEDLARRRFVVSEAHPVRVGRAPEDPADIAVKDWLYEASAAWISPVHLTLEVRDGALVVTDVSENGTVVWQRPDPHGPATTMRLHRASYVLGEWDSVELYTGVELTRGDRRLATVVGRSEPISVLVDAPTVAMPVLRAAS